MTLKANILKSSVTFLARCYLYILGLCKRWNTESALSRRPWKVLEETVPLALALTWAAKVRGFGLDHEAHIFGLCNEDQDSLALDSETCTCWTVLVFEFRRNYTRDIHSLRKTYSCI